MDAEERRSSTSIMSASAQKGMKPDHRTDAVSPLDVSETHFRSLSDNLPLIVWMHDAEGRQEFVNLTFCEYFGVKREQMREHQWQVLMHPDDAAQYTSEFFASIRERRRFHAEVRVRRADGAWRWLESWGRPWFAEDGAYFGHVGTSADVTDRKLEERHRELLIGELDHRVKNVLTIVQGIAHQTFKKASVPSALMKSFQQRLGTLAAAYRQITRSNWKPTPLLELVRDTVSTVCGIADGRIRIEGPPAEVEASAAVTLAMALHELCTNAIKHGSLSTDGGRVEVGWSISDGPTRTFTLVWREQGGPAVQPPHGSGFGLDMLQRGLARELRGTVRLEFPAEGLICTIEGSLGRSNIKDDCVGP